VIEPGGPAGAGTFRHPDAYPKETHLVMMNEVWAAPHRSGSIATLNLVLSGALR